MTMPIAWSITARASSAPANPRPGVPARPGWRPVRARPTRPPRYRGPAEPDFPERAGARRVEVQRSDLPVADPQGHRQRRPNPGGGGASPELGPLTRLRGVLDAGDLPSANCAQARPVRERLLDQFHPGGQLVTPGDRRREPADQQDDSARRPGAPLLADRQHRQIRQQLVDAKGSIAIDSSVISPRPSGEVGHMINSLAKYLPSRDVSPRPDYAWCERLAHDLRVIGRTRQSRDASKAPAQAWAMVPLLLLLLVPRTITFDYKADGFLAL